MRLLNIQKIFCCLSIGAAIFILPTKAHAFIDEDRISRSKALAHYIMGQVFDLNGQSSQAVEEYKAAADFDEANYWVHLRLGLSYARMNKLADTLREFQSAQQYNPDDMQSHYWLARIYSNLKEYDRAAEEYEIILKKLVKAEPQNTEVYGYLGQLYYSQKKYNQAIEQFEKMLQLDPKNASVLYLLGSLYFEVGQKQKAIDALAKSIQLDPKDDGSLNTLGYIYAENNDRLDEALDLVNRALQISPNNGAYLDSLGWVYYKKGMYDKALEVLKKADVAMKDPVIYSHLGDVCYKMNRFEDAAKYWQLSLQMQPDQKEIIRKLESIKNFQASR